ncbi:hypothetical protein [Thermoactinomyces sp. CICC 10521]|uniref:hypothetical protein n=1 Tax=Thermoactinomyces sp. CICC 10521 TaxID=2767426 RepID=UPI0018DBE750|nr:hypothetical protein [Thermoactinomyces sp. CICC 10521]MBH8606295.1 hypothetical protein [Thermoactinomyces sp. CICC 10521]
MDTFLYPLITILYLVLFVWSFRFFRESSFWGTSWILFLILTFIYDHAVLSVGNLFGEGDLLEMLSLFRYLFDVLLTPTLVFVSLDILRRIQVEWSEYLIVQVFTHLYTFLLTVLGIFTNILWINLEPVRIHGVIQYFPSKNYFPYSTILALLPLVVAAFFLWRQLRWPVLLAGIVIAVVGVGFACAVDNPAIGSVFELVLMWSLVMTELLLKSDDYGPGKSVLR